MDIENVTKILKQLGFDERFNSEQTAICVLSLLHNHPNLLRIHDIIAYSRKNLNKNYAENTRESIRKSSLKRLVNHGLTINNKDNPARSTNSGSNNYCLTDEFYVMLKSSDSKRKQLIAQWNKTHKNIVKQLADLKHEISIKFPDNKQFKLSPGPHNILEKHIVEDFVSKKIKKAEMIYLGDTRNKMLYVNDKLVKKLGIILDKHDKLPDVIAWSHKSKRFYVIESVTSVGPVEESRKNEIDGLLNKKSSKHYEIVFITAFLDRKTFRKFSDVIAKNTYVWIASEPDGWIHYSNNGIDL